MTIKNAQSIKPEIKEKVNELSLLSVMSSAQDQVGVSMLCDMFDALAREASSDPGATRLIEGWRYVKSKKGSSDPEAFFRMLQELINTSVVFCESSGDVTFIYEKGDSTSDGNFLEGVDLSFLPEFIETHRLQLEDLESWLLDCEFKSEDGETVDALVRRYIHSLKGDAGSLGLKEIAQGCHYVEDVLAEVPVATIVGQMMLFREWAGSYIEALSANQQPKERATEFISRFKKACDLLRPQEASKSSDSKEHVKPEVNNTDSTTYSLSGDLEIFQEFMAEALEHLANVEGIMLEAEGNYSKESVDTIFRGIHSLKGGSAYFNFKDMTETSHLLESMLDQVRDGKRELDQSLAGLVLSYIDLQKALLNAAKSALAGNGSMTRNQSAKSFLETLRSYADGGKVTPPSSSSESKKPTVAGQASPTAEADETSAQQSSLNKKSEALEVKNFVKVDTVRLDHLIDSIGEMVIYSSMLIRRCQELLPEHEDVQMITHRVEKFTRDLQDVGMSMRLVPIKSLFQKMSRLVWDTSKKINKEIAFSMDGEDTELDRNLIDKLADPLMHMVRNALDHGVEPPDERIKAGKPKAGKVHLSASHSGGCVMITIQDDGRGLNPEKLLNKAKEKGIVSEGQKLSEQEIFQLIFAPGFSTAAVVTDISGRGVGMDVVRRNVESLRGRIHISSTIGQGTTFTIEIPLTLAIIDGIEVTVANEHFIIPSLSIVEFVKPTKEMLNIAMDQAETLNFRGRYLPIFRLGDIYDIEAKHTDPSSATFVVVDNHDELVAIMVDEVLGELSTVIKSLGPVFSGVKGVSGCAVMPDGDVALILDIRSLVQLTRNNYKRVSDNSLDNQSTIN